VKARDGNRTRTKPRIQPIRLAYPVQSIRSSGAKFYPSLTYGLQAVVLTISPNI
jgi:hypothetical protein